MLIRFGINRFTTEDEVDYTIEKCVHNVNRLREMRWVLFLSFEFKEVVEKSVTIRVKLKTSVTTASRKRIDIIEANVLS